MRRFFTGLDDIAHARHFDAVFLSVARLRRRKADFAVNDWIMDSGAFSELRIHHRYRYPVEEYAGQIKRWKVCGNLLAAVSQDMMCEAEMLERTGLTVKDHQRITIERYDELLRCQTGVLIMPVLQGYLPQEYVEHLAMYGDRLAPGAWVGVGSVCKRNRDAGAIEEVLLAIHAARPDLRLHGFGVKTTSLESAIVNELLDTADSMAWSYAARRENRNAHDWREAKRWTERITTRPVQMPLFLPKPF